MTLPSIETEKEVVKSTSKIEKVSLTITEELLTILRKERLDINSLFILVSLYNHNIDLLDVYDDNTTDTVIILNDYHKLYLHGYIKDGEKDSMFELTEKGTNFIVSILPILSESKEDRFNSAAFKQLCNDYVEIFPKIKLPSGKYARSNIVEIEKKMKNFLNTYRNKFKSHYGFEFSYEDILKVTKLYVNKYAMTGYLYMSTSSYFIQKDDKSILADELVAFKQGIDVANIKTNITGM